MRRILATTAVTAAAVSACESTTTPATNLSRTR
jgi:hypothetical protein